MVVYYKSGGIVALFSVELMYFWLLHALPVFSCHALHFLGWQLLVLTIGMAVDANILIFERIREELKAGKSSENALLEDMKGFFHYY